LKALKLSEEDQMNIFKVEMLRQILPEYTEEQAMELVKKHKGMGINDLLNTVFMPELGSNEE